MPDIKLPDGRIIKNVPEGTTKAVLTQKLISKGVLTGKEDFLQQPKEEVVAVTQTQAQTPPQGFEQNLQQAQQSDTQALRQGGRNALDFLQGIPEQLGDRFVGAVQGGADLLGATDFSKRLGDIQGQKIAERGQPSGFRQAGQVVGDIAALAPLSGGGLVAGGLKTGAASGFTGLQTEGEGLGGRLFKTGQEALIGGAVGGGLKAVGAGGKAIAKKAGVLPKKQTTPLLEDAAKRGFDELEAFTSVRTGLQKEAAKQNTQINTLFKTAKEKGKNASINNNDLSKLSDDLFKDVDDVIDLDGKQFLQSTAKTFDDLSSKDIGNTINKLQSFRRQASKVVRKDQAGSEGAKRVLEKVDKFLDTVKIEGDQEAVNLWKKAITSRREFGQKFEKPAKIAQAIDESKTTETIETAFIGNAPISQKKDLAQTYKETLRALPLDKRKDAGFALRQSGLNNLLKNASKASDSAEGLSANRLSNGIRNLRRENKSFWDLYTNDEKVILSRLESELRKTAEGGIVNKVYKATERFIRAGIKSNVELPRTLKAKTIIDIDDLLELSSFRPASKSSLPLVAGTQTINQD